MTEEPTIEKSTNGIQIHWKFAVDPCYGTRSTIRIEFSFSLFALFNIFLPFNCCHRHILATVFVFFLLLLYIILLTRSCFYWINMKCDVLMLFHLPTDSMLMPSSNLNDILFDRSFYIFFEFSLSRDSDKYLVSLSCAERCIVTKRGTITLRKPNEDEWNLWKRVEMKTRKKPNEKINNLINIVSSGPWPHLRHAFVEFCCVVVCKCSKFKCRHLHICIYISVTVVARAMEYNATIDWRE